MISQQHGMANEIVQMTNRELGTTKRIGVDVHCLWCIDHRLNLFAMDFNKVPNINFVITFIDWITAKDMLVSYTAFVKARQETTKKEKIPHPLTQDGFSTETPSLHCSSKLKRLMRF